MRKYRKLTFCHFVGNVYEFHAKTMQQRSNEIALYRSRKIVLPTQSPLTFFPLQQQAGLRICYGIGRQRQARQ
jgi:hypothetical protein